jgi:hypothetical protein
MRTNSVRFSILNHAAWAPHVHSAAQWRAWAHAPFPFANGDEPSVTSLPPMLRRRAGFLGKMALEVAYECLAGHTDVPTVFCSRHGEVSRALDLLNDLVHGEPLSPTAFGLAVHNASAGLFSIARKDQSNHIALAAGTSTIEHAVIEACGLLADGAPMVLLVAYDNALPTLFTQFQDCDEQPYAWAWLMIPAQENVMQLTWEANEEVATEQVTARSNTMSDGLAVLQLQLLSQNASHQTMVLERKLGARCWHWSRHA